MPDYRFVNSKLMDCRHVERDDHYCGLIDANYIHNIPDGDDPNGDLGHPYVAPPQCRKYLIVHKAFTYCMNKVQGHTDHIFMAADDEARTLPDWFKHASFDSTERLLAHHLDEVMADIS